MELMFLGTGAGMPSKERNVTSIVLNLLQENNSLWLFDCGEATQHQMLYTKLKPRKVNKIFITHLHGDHLFGLPGFLSSRSFHGGNNLLTIYGPPGIKQFVSTSLEVSHTQLSYELEIVEIKDGIIFEDELFTVHCDELVHNVPSFAFKVVEKDLPGQLQVEKLKALGIKPGPIYKQIKDNEQVELEDGTIIDRKQFIGPAKRGKIISIFGDTIYSEQHSEFAENADVLVHESTFSSEMEETALNYYHSTTTQAASLAKKAQVNQLILTHISSMYQKGDINMLLEEAKEVFPNTIIAEDFLIHQIK